jgi:O-succinylbenzoate synthase
MLQATYIKYILNFKMPAGTSRGVLNTKETWFIKIWNNNHPSVFGIGECAIFRGLSFDDIENYEAKLQECCKNINNNEFLASELISLPSIKFGIETALLDLENKGKRIIYASSFTSGTEGIPINGLIWMGSIDYIKTQIREKLNNGYTCLKFKVGAINLKDEYELLANIRKEFSPESLEIRLDANGAFPANEALLIIKEFSKFNIHSIEQPIRQGNILEMQQLCSQSPIPIALDEELIGIIKPTEKEKLLTEIKPQYIIIKPALIGGFSGGSEWIGLAKKNNIGWWITSALESNIGLNAIAQWTKTLQTNMTQGLGTGSLFTNNIESPLYIREQKLYSNPEINWDLSNIKFDE